MFLYDDGVIRDLITRARNVVDETLDFVAGAIAACPRPVIAAGWAGLVIGLMRHYV
jgi:hypothetical protein